MLLTLPTTEEMIWPSGYGVSPNFPLVDFGLSGLAACPAGSSEDSVGDCWDANGDLVGVDPALTDVVSPSQLSTELSVPSSTFPSPSVIIPSSSGGSTTSQDLIAAANASSAAANALLRAQGPSLIPGTSAIYNPATGQVTTALGTNLSAASAPLAAISSYLPLIVVVGVIFLFIKK